MTHYTLAVGSTATYRAHDDEGRLGDVLTSLPIYSSRAVTGVWDDVPEDTMLYTLELPDDATALRIATGLAMLTANACVLVSRAIQPGDDSPMGSLRKFRVATRFTDTGDRTITDPATGTGYRYAPDITGNTVAFLAWRDGRATTV